ncbi:glycosyltransferase [Myxococcota bacterium]
MRSLHITDRLSSRGGADWHLLGVLDALGGDELHLAVGQDDGTAARPCPLTVLEPLAARLRVDVCDAGQHIEAGLEQLLDRFSPHIIHVHNVVNPTVLEWAADRGAVMTVQDHRCFCPGRGKVTEDNQVCHDAMSRQVCTDCFSDEGYFGELLALTHARLAAVRRMRLTVLSNYMKRELVAVGVPKDSVAVIAPFVHGLDLDAEADGPPCVLFVGRVVAAKGILEAIEAWRRSGVGLPLVIAGTGSERHTAEAAGCEVLGWVSHADLSRLYRRARAVLLPSRWQEPFGIVGLEALTMGVPVVAWESGGVSDWHAGELVPWGDVEGLARALRRAVSEPASIPAGFERQHLMDKLARLYHEMKSPLHRSRLAE